MIRNLLLSSAVLLGLGANIAVYANSSGPLFNVKVVMNKSVVMGIPSLQSLEVLTTPPGKAYLSASVQTLSLPESCYLKCPSGQPAPCTFAVSDTSPAFIDVVCGNNMMPTPQPSFPIDVKLCLQDSGSEYSCEKHNLISLCPIGFKYSIC